MGAAAVVAKPRLAAFGMGRTQNVWGIEQKAARTRSVSARLENGGRDRD
jgi:hypothetical protein